MRFQHHVPLLCWTKIRAVVPSKYLMLGFVRNILFLNTLITLYCRDLTLFLRNSLYSQKGSWRISKLCFHLFNMTVKPWTWLQWAENVICRLLSMVHKRDKHFIQVSTLNLSGPGWRTGSCHGRLTLWDRHSGRSNVKLIRLEKHSLFSQKGINGITTTPSFLSFI